MRSSKGHFSLQPPLIALVVYLLLAHPPARAYEPAEGKISATAGVLGLQTDFSGLHPGRGSPTHPGAFLSVTGDANQRGALEVMAFTASKTFLRRVGDSFHAETTRMVQIDMGYRRYLASWLSAGLSFSSAYSLGDAGVEFSDFASDSRPDTSAADLTEYGAVVSLQTEIWSADLASMTVDLRYNHSVTPKPDERAHHWGLFIGYKHLIQPATTANQPPSR